MIHITDFNGNIIDFISKSDGAVTEAEHMINVEDKLETFDFTILTSRTSNLQTRNRILITDKDGQYREFIIYNISSDLNGYTRVQTNASALEDIKTAKPVAPHKLDKHTVKQALEYVLADTGWEVSDDSEWGGTRTTSWTGWHDRISVLKQLETTYGMRVSFYVEVGSNKVAKRYVSLNKVEPLFKGEEIVYGDNMIDLKRTVDFSDIATALICLGPEDSETGKREIVEIKDDDAQAQFGLPYRYIWDIYEPQSSDENMTRKRLTTLGRTALNKRKQASISYDIDGIGLSASAGDMIRVKNEDFTPELYVDAEVVEVTTDLISGESQYKFGVIKEYTRDDVYARFNAMLSGLRERLNKVVENTDSIISERLEEELKYVERYIEKSPTPPLNPKEGQLWLDTSHDGVAVLKRYENGQWIKSSVDDVKDIGGMTREETMYETLKLRLNRNEINFNEAFNRYDTLSKDKYYQYVDQALKQQLSSAINQLSATFSDFKSSFNAINSERPTIGLITSSIDSALKYEQALKQYEAIYLKARESYDEYVRVLQSQYSDEKFNEAMEEVASAIGGTFDGEKIVADIPLQEDLKALNDSIRQYLNGELSALDGKLGKQIETVVKQAKDEFSVAIDSMEKKVDGIAIGGRNLITGTSDKFKTTTFSGWTGGFSENVYVGVDNVLQQGDEVVASVYIKSGEQKTALLVNEIVDNTRVRQLSGNYIPAKEEGYSVIKFKISKDVTRLLLHLRHNAGDTPSDTKQYKELMLVKGNTPTDWFPAPEDTEDKISSLTQEVTKNTTSISVLENEISLKADSNTVKQMLDSELNAVKSSVQTNQAELKVLSNQLSSKVEKTEYTTDMNGITRDISNTKTEVKQLSDSVNSKITSVEQKFDSLEIGGTNLLRNSNNFSANTWKSYDNAPLNVTENVSVEEWGATDATQVYVGEGDRTSILKIYKQITNSTNTVEGETYTVSFYVKNIRDVPMSVNVNGITAPPVDIEPNEAKRVVFTGKRTTNHLQLQFRSNGVNFYAEFIVWRAKVEKGNKVSDWSPSPEDYQSQIDNQGNILTKHETEIEQNKLGLNTKVSYTEMNGTNKTLEKLLTEFSQSSTGFNFRIDSNGMIQDLTFDRNRFKLNHNLIEFNDGDVVIKDGRTTIKDAFIEKLKSTIITSEQVRVAYNNISNSIQITPSGLETTIEGSLASRLNSFGQHFYYKGDYIGAIGTGNLTNYPNIRGLSMTLDSFGEYLAFGYRPGNVDADDPAQVALLWSKGSGGYSRGFHFNEDIKIKHNKVIETLWLRPSNYIGITDRISFSSGQIGGIQGVSLRYRDPGGSGIHLANNRVTIHANDSSKQGVGDLIVMFDNSGYLVRSYTIYNRTYSSASNVYITSYGTIGRSTSARKYKLAIEKQFNDHNEQLNHSKKILELDPKTWFDKSEAEIYAEEIKTGEKQTDDDFTLQRHFGMIADEFEEIGMSELISYDSKTGEVEGLAYDRIPVHHNVLIKDLYKENNELKERIEKLEELING